MPSQVRTQLDAKLRSSSKPTPLAPTPSLWAPCSEIKKQHMVKEAREKVDTLRGAGIKATVVVEAE